MRYTSGSCLLIIIRNNGEVCNLPERNRQVLQSMPSFILLLTIASGSALAHDP